MGIRFACHVCGKHLNIKRDLAGRRGVCPACSARFRIPWEDSATSAPIASEPVEGTEVSMASASAGPTATPESRAMPAQAATAESLSSAVAAHSASVTGEVADPSGDDSSAPGTVEGSIDLLSDDADACWYVRPPSGGQYGPASGEILRQWIAEGRVASTSLLWRDGWPQWRDASEALPEFAGRLPNGNVETGTVSPVASDGMSDGAGSASLVGDSTLGTERRSRSLRRVVVIGILSVVAVTLVGVLMVVVNR